MQKAKSISHSQTAAIVLLVEDDPIVGPLIRDLLRGDGYRVEWATSVTDAEKHLQSHRFHLAILDVNLPDGNGLDLCRSIREASNPIPVLMLTSISEEDTIVKAFALGVNDYLRKPFGKKELLARVRFQTKGKKGVLIAGPLTIDIDRREAKVGETALSLSPMEFQILTLLAKNIGSDVAREKILHEVDPEGNTAERTLDSHVSHIRKKLEKTKAGVKLTSVPRIGYRLEA